jgi:hypothetical protein
MAKKINLNRTAKLAFYNARERKNDTNQLSEITGYTPRFINYVKKGERKVNDTLANAMYNLAKKRVKNSTISVN